MLLSRKLITDSKGQQVPEVILSVPDASGHPKHVALAGDAAYRYDDIAAALQSFGYVFPKSRTGAYDSTDPLAWNISQLAYTESAMLKRQRVPALYKQLFDVSYEAPPWAETIEYQTYDEVGIGVKAANDSTDMPFADARFGRNVIQVSGGKIGYHYDVQELIASAQLKRPLSDLRMANAMTAFERHINAVALRGETASGFQGLWSNSSITPVAATTGNWDYTGTSPLDILADLNMGITAVYQATGSNDVVTDIAMPIEAINALATRVLTATSSGVTVVAGTTLLDFLKEHNLSKTMQNVDIRFHGIPSDPDALTTANSSLNTAGALKHTGAALTPGTLASRVVYWVKHPDKMRLHIPLPLTFLAPQPRNMDVVVPGRYRYAGLEISYPKSVYYQDNVLHADPQSS